MTAIKQPMPPADLADAQRERTFDLFRSWGFLQANLDPLAMHVPPLPFPELDELDGPAADEARRIYCGTVGVEFMHIPDREERRWIAERMESTVATPDRSRILDLLLRAELFEQSIQSRYLGTKRFSLEGITALIPFLDQVMKSAIDSGAAQAVLAMSHRGRLSVMVHIVGTSTADIFSKFEDVDPRSVLGGGDVKYHIGATGDYVAPDGRKLHVHLVSNPSHLEAVDPVAMGRTRAKQVRRGDAGPEQVFAVVIHGDAAFAGQGVWAETMNFAEVPGYSVGGSIHVIANNLIGFTTEPEEEHSSRFASSLARRNNIPIFHVNGEDPEAVVRVAQIALDYRYTFGRDIVVDILGYRRHGHSEVDDPTITQPLVYKRIKEHPPLWQLYANAIGMSHDAGALAKHVQEELNEAQKKGAAATKQPRMATLPEYWSKYTGGCYKKEYDVNTGVSAEELQRIAGVIGSAPNGFHVHAKVKKLLDQRREMGAGKRPIDYGMAEALAFGTLLASGTPVRLSGQDSRRGTFNQRHDVLIDTENGDEYLPLQHVSPDQARFEVYNSTLSEAGVMGFEYGYSRDFPETLTLWEAQFGDFANSAQIIIDQFIAAGEDKWNLLSGLVLLLPHGYEGQGPEHSSARIERYLQLAARDNMQICQPSNAAQYFHLLRRQIIRPWRKPLVVFTPKSMLRNSDAASPLADFSAPRFLNVLPDRQVENASRVLLCSGKIGHELREERKRRKDTLTAIVFLEQMYPFPEAELQAEFDRHQSAREIVWVQEEPANMGALWFVMPRLRRLAKGRPARSIKRSGSASPATGSAKAHELEQKTLLALAFA